MFINKLSKKAILINSDNRSYIIFYILNQIII